MNTEEFREFAKSAVDYVANYFEDIRKKSVVSRVEPGYLTHELPSEAPEKGQNWRDILPDIDRLILPGLSHWHSPHFHAYYPTANSFPGIVGELVLAGLGSVSKDWESNPASVELEIRMMDWLAILLGLPEYFLNSSDGPGGGVIQNAASESTLVGLLCSKCKKIKNALKTMHNTNKAEVEGKLVAYTSEQSNSSVEKAGLLASVKMRLLPTDSDGSLRGAVLAEAIAKDKEQGFIPCCVVATLGTTGTCAFDNLEELGQICKKEDMWLHVDAAYAGAALSCPEYRYLLKGIDYVDSFNFNPHKWMLVNSDCSAMWFKDTKEAEDAFKVKATIKVSELIPEIQHWQIPNTRRFRALKLWFVLRIYGVEGVQKHIRHQIELAKYFEELVRSDQRFEVVTSSLGVVCFRIIGEDSLTQDLEERLGIRKKLFIMPYFYKNKWMVRFVVCSRFTERKDIEFAWNEILSQTHVNEDGEVLRRNDLGLDVTKKTSYTEKISQQENETYIFINPTL